MTKLPLLPHLSEIEKSDFIKFLNYLANNVSNEEEYATAVDTFKERAYQKSNSYDFEKLILKAAAFIADSVIGFKESHWKNFNQKKGFDIFYRLAPREVREVLENGVGSERDMMHLYSEKERAVSILLKNGIKVTNGKIAVQDIEAAIAALIY